VNGITDKLVTSSTDEMENDSAELGVDKLYTAAINPPLQRIVWKYRVGLHG
jgi:hypothetical protein